MNTIEHKLNQFTRKYYTNELIKGVILFVVLGFVYLFFTIFIEYMLWLKPHARTFLFWLFIGVELFLLIRFIGFPIFKLIGLKKGITPKESSKIIGAHFPEVNDKLTNFLQLKNNSLDSELLKASIEQKSKELTPIPFSKAINFKNNLKYSKYILIPVLIYIFIYFTGKTKDINNSLKRIVNHNVKYLPPAPFSYHLINNNLDVVQGKALKVIFEIRGSVIPEEVKIFFNNEHYFLDKEDYRFFSYTFNEINTPIQFYLKANGLESKDYQINLIETPTIQQLSMQLNYPTHLKKASKTIKNTGNITVPEGTTIKWNLKTQHTDSVKFINNYKKYYFNKNKNNFSFSKQIKEPTNYQISTSNKKNIDFEKLQFTIDVVKDEIPQINVKSNIDSITRGTAFFAGKIADDNGFNSLSVVYYNIDNPNIINRKKIKISSENVQNFFYSFPNKSLKLIDGINYELYFEVYDNDVVNGFKKATSKRFSYRKKTQNEEQEEILKEQKSHIDELSKSLEKQENVKKDLEKLQFDLQNKKKMSWNDQKKIEQLVKRQEQYKKMMQKHTEKLEKNFSEKKELTKSLQEKKEALQERIKELKKIEKQQKLLDELQKLADKLNKENLIRKTKELAQQNKQQERSLERILEMTKQFYVEQKLTQLSQKLEDLAKKQEELTKNKNSTKEDQEKINKEFNDLKKQLKEVEKQNEKLKNPMEIPSLEELKRDTEKQMQGAKENLEQNKQSDAKQKQKKASQNMKKMSQKMQQAMQEMSMEMQEENMENLRYLTENLITYSFDQEELMNVFSKTTAQHPDFGKNLKRQYKLKTYFEHIDDSLFALSMRLPKLSTDIDEKIAKAHYNIDQSLENFAEAQFQSGIKNQRYVMTAVNELADMLSNTLDAMKNPKRGKGKGKGKSQSLSLPDIIKKQGELMEQMRKGLQKQEGKGKGKKGKQSDSEEQDGELYKIFQKQTKLREEFEKAMNQKGKNSNGKESKKIIDDMKQLENQILKRGLTHQNLNKMQRLQHQLLKLKDASFEQGEDEKRKSTSNTKEYNYKDAKLKEFKKKYFNQTEILNRQSLPLKSHFKKKVQEYFKIEN